MNVLKRMLSGRKKRVYSFHDDVPDGKDLLGVKGAHLCEIAKIGLPVPPGFVITTENYHDFLYHEAITPELVTACTEGIHNLERETGRKFGTPSNNGQLPLLLSVRGGTTVMTPGIMHTVLNLGVTDSLVDYIAQVSNKKFALDVQRIFLMDFGSLVLRADKAQYDSILDEILKRENVQHASDLTVEALQEVVTRYKAIVEIPQDPQTQLKLAVAAFYTHTFSPQVMKFLSGKHEHPSAEHLGVAITVQAMVYGNLNGRSGSGIAFIRHPEGGMEDEITAEFLPNSEGDLVAATSAKHDKTHMATQKFANAYPDQLGKLRKAMKRLERHDDAVQYVEFTIEDSKIYILETSAVNLRPNKKDANYQVFLGLLNKFLTEEEEEEEEANAAKQQG